jgi:opacity protein-like surface antigen
MKLHGLMTVATITVLFCGLLGLWAQPASAEWYIGGTVGATIPNGLTNTSGTGQQGGTLATFTQQTTLSYGGKVGYFFERYKWLGLDMDVSNSTPNINAKQASVSGGTGLGANNGQNLRMTVWSTNLIARYPGERFRPYVGGGLGVFFANAAGASSADWAPGATGFAGLNILLIEHVSMSLEYRYHYANLRFDNVLGPGRGFESTYTANTINLGLNYHF